MKSWIDDEFKESKFSNDRLGKRLCKIVKQLFDKMGNSFPMTCQDWASTKAVDRFFSNSNLSEEQIGTGQRAVEDDRRRHGQSIVEQRAGGVKRRKSLDVEHMAHHNDPALALFGTCEGYWVKKAVQTKHTLLCILHSLQ